MSENGTIKMSYNVEVSKKIYSLSFVFCWDRLGYGCILYGFSSSFFCHITLNVGTNDYRYCSKNEHFSLYFICEHVCNKGITNER